MYKTINRHILYALIPMLFYCNISILNAQEVNRKEIIVEGDIQSAFEKTVDFLVKQEFL